MTNNSNAITVAAGKTQTVRAKACEMNRNVCAHPVAHGQVKQAATFPHDTGLFCPPDGTVFLAQNVADFNREAFMESVERLIEAGKGLRSQWFSASRRPASYRSLHTNAKVSFR